MSGLSGIPPRPIIGGIPGPFSAGGNERDAGDGSIEGAFDVGGIAGWLLPSTLACGGCVLVGGTERVGAALTAAVVVGVFVVMAPAALDAAGTTGGVDDPSREGIEIDESEDVDETGEGIAVTFADTPLLEAAFVLGVGASKFDIVGECFLLLADPLRPPGDCVAGDATIDCLEFGDETEVDVHVVGILLAALAAADVDLPFGIVTAEPGCWPLFCTEPT